tara:strand:+ start:171 stop:356 length:186 start_codon:yes stop_codon:yes gene_type:complete
MKIKLNKTDYIEIESKNKKEADFNIKIKKNSTTSSFINIKLTSDILDKVISELVKARAKIE